MSPEARRACRRAMACRRRRSGRSCCCASCATITSCAWTLSTSAARRALGSGACACRVAKLPRADGALERPPHLLPFRGDGSYVAWGPPCPLLCCGVALRKTTPPACAISRASCRGWVCSARGTSPCPPALLSMTVSKVVNPATSAKPLSSGRSSQACAQGCAMQGPSLLQAPARRACTACAAGGAPARRGASL